MSLLDAFSEDFVMMDKTTVPDGYGSVIVQWKEGAPFKGSMSLDSSMESRIAQKQGVTSVYTLLVSKGIPMDYHDVFKRVEDGVTFRVTSNGRDKKTPEGAGIDARSVSAEEWSIPNG